MEGHGEGTDTRTVPRYQCRSIRLRNLLTASAPCTKSSLFDFPQSCFMICFSAFDTTIPHHRCSPIRSRLGPFMYRFSPSAPVPFFTSTYLSASMYLLFAISLFNMIPQIRDGHSGGSLARFTLPHSLFPMSDRRPAFCGKVDG